MPLKNNTKSFSMTDKSVVSIMHCFLSVVFFGFIILFGLTGCSKGSGAKTADDFSDVANYNGYVLSDITNDYGQKSSIDSAVVAQDPDYTYQIEFYECSNGYAKTAFEQLKSDVIETIGENPSQESASEEKNGESYSISGGGNYYRLQRIDDTLMYGFGPEKNKSQIDDLFEEMDY